MEKTGKPKRRPVKRKISQSQIILDWLKRLSKSELDPSSTFSSIDIWGDSAICRKKKKYPTYRDAILEIIRMEQARGNQILQMPYKCECCYKYHNTHLISRKGLQELISKFEKEIEKQSK